MSVAQNQISALERRRRVRQFLYRLRGQYGAMVGGTIVLIFILVALLAPIIAPYDPLQRFPGELRQPPSREFLFGTDEIGRDLLSRIIYGSRISLQVGLIAVGIGAVSGSVFGLIAGYFGSWIDTIVMRIVDVMLAFPGILLAIAIVAILGPSIRNVMIAVGIEFIPAYVRTVRGATLSVKENDYISAAKAGGATEFRIIFKHVLPNVLNPVIVLGTLGVGIAILAAAGLSFIGLGAQPPLPEWGTMLANARGYLRESPWMAIFPGATIMIVVLALNLFGDSLRELLDPRSRNF
jgi:peptide/nickel transport system permease protein